MFWFRFLAEEFGGSQKNCCSSDGGSARGGEPQVNRDRDQAGPPRFGSTFSRWGHNEALGSDSDPVQTDQLQLINQVIMRTKSALEGQRDNQAGTPRTGMGVWNPERPVGLRSTPRLCV